MDTPLDLRSWTLLATRTQSKNAGIFTAQQLADNSKRSLEAVLVDAIPLLLDNGIIEEYKNAYRLTEAGVSSGIFR